MCPSTCSGVAPGSAGWLDEAHPRRRPADAGRRDGGRRADRPTLGHEDLAERHCARHAQSCVGKPGADHRVKRLLRQACCGATSVFAAVTRGIHAPLASDELLGDRQAEVLDRHPGRPPEGAEGISAGVEHRRELLVVGKHHGAVQVLGAEALSIARESPDRSCDLFRATVACSCFRYASASRTTLDVTHSGVVTSTT